MLTKLTDEQLAGLAKGITAGPWRWEINPKGRQIQLCGGKPEYDLTVMDFVRWGMNGAQPRVLTKNGRGMELLEKAESFKAVAPKREHHASWFQLLKHPDLDLMAAAPQLLAEVLQSRRTLERYRGALELIVLNDVNPRTSDMSPLARQVRMAKMAREALKED
jgi:hypothetical protein